MANTIFKDLTTRAAFTTSPNDKVVSLWIGDSVVSATSVSVTADIIDPTSIYPSVLTGIAKYWDKWGTAADGSAARLTFADTKAGGGAAAWADVLEGGGGISGNLAYVAPYYGASLYHAGNGGAAFTPHVSHASTTKHHTVVLGISGSALNNDVSVVTTPLAHWDPAIANGAFTLLTEHYIQPAFAALQASSGVVYLDALYIHVAGDANSSFYSFDSAQNYGSHLLRLIAAVEKFLEFPGIPVVIVRTPKNPPGFAWSSSIRKAQQRLATYRPRTFTLNTDGLAQHTDHIHFTGMAAVKAGYDAAQLVRAGLPDQWANITKAF